MRSQYIAENQILAFLRLLMGCYCHTMRYSLMRSLLTYLAFAFLTGSCDPPQAPIDTRPKEDIRVMYFDDSEDIRMLVTYKDRVRHGVAKQFYRSGELHTVMMYDQGMKCDTAIYYYPSGAIYRLTPYVDDVRHGLQRGYHENGTLRFEMPYWKGEPRKGLVEYLKNGKKRTPPVLVKSNMRYTKRGYAFDVSIEPDFPMVKYYNEPLSPEGTIINPKKVARSTDGVCTIHNSTRGMISYRDISAKVWTADKNCYVISKEFQSTGLK